MMTYKGFIGRIVLFDNEINMFHGEIINKSDVITFQAETMIALEKAFRDSVDDYLELRKEKL